MKYLAILGRLPKLSLAELSAQFGDSTKEIGEKLATFESPTPPDINRFGGSIKFGELIPSRPVDYLLNLDFSGKFIVGFSDYSKKANRRKSGAEAMKIKKILSRYGRSCRVLANSEAALSSAASHHNQMGEKPGHIEFLKVEKEFYRLIGVQNITAYKNRDQVRPARDAKVGMLPPKLAQILINLCGPLEKDARILDPFCGTGVLLQEAILDGYKVYGTDLSERMVEYSKKNLKWLTKKQLEHASEKSKSIPKREDDSPKQLDENRILLSAGDATNFKWTEKIDAVACETYLGSPLSRPPAEIVLKEQKQECSKIILDFLKNISSQIEPNTPLALAVPAWLRPYGYYERLSEAGYLFDFEQEKPKNFLDQIKDLGYNIVKLNNLGQDDLLYFREGQIVAREIIVLRKK